MSKFDRMDKYAREDTAWYIAESFGNYMTNDVCNGNKERAFHNLCHDLMHAVTINGDGEVMLCTDWLPACISEWVLKNRHNAAFDEFFDRSFR